MNPRLPGQHVHPVPATTFGRFTIADLSAIRRLISRAAVACHLAAPAVANLVGAVDEIATNAIQHAGGHGSLTIGHAPDGMRIDISDDGPGLPAGQAPDHLPTADAIAGRGLWIARYLWPDMAFLSRGDGLTVTFRAHTGPPQPTR